MENKKNIFMGLKIGYALTGSFCTFEKSFYSAKKLIERGAELIPIMSENAASTDTRFGNAADNVRQMEYITGKKVIKTIAEAEPLGPQKMCDLVLIAPCTGNTIAKITNSITDTAVTMAVKSHIRNQRPVLICPATNDALAGSAKNIASLFNSKHYYFVPYAQDDPVTKPTSVIGEFDLIPEAIAAAMNGVQLQPVFR